MSEEAKTPEQWCKEFHVHMVSPLGWTMYGKDFNDPISRHEFQFRLTHSIAHTETPKPPCQ